MYFLTLPPGTYIFKDELNQCRNYSVGFQTQVFSNICIYIFKYIYIYIYIVFKIESHILVIITSIIILIITLNILIINPC